MVFRRDNKVDSFQRQMSALRNQLGNTGDELGDNPDEMPELNEDQFPEGDAYRNQANALDQDSGAYSFGTYPPQPGQAVPSQMEDEAPSLPEMPAADGLISVIAREATWKGDINSENSVHVFGKVEGTLNAREDVWVAEGAEVDATITAQRVIVGGVVSGTINASSRFEALPSGQVSADVSSPITVVHEGASINGNFKVGGGDSSGDSRSERAGAASVIQRRTRNAS